MKLLLMFWIFCLASCASAQTQTMMILLQVNDDEYRLADVWIISRNLPESLGSQHLTTDALKWKIVNAEGESLKNGIIEDPQALKSHQIETGHFVPSVTHQSEATVLIRVTYDSTMKELLIEKVPDIHLEKVKQKPRVIHRLPLNPRAEDSPQTNQAK